MVMETLQRFYSFTTAAANGNAASTGGPAEFQDDSSWAESDAKDFATLNRSVPGRECEVHARQAWSHCRATSLILQP